MKMYIKLTIRDISKVHYGKKWHTFKIEINFFIDIIADYLHEGNTVRMEKRKSKWNKLKQSY